MMCGKKERYIVPFLNGLVKEKRSWKGRPTKLGGRAENSGKRRCGVGKDGGGAREIISEAWQKGEGGEGGKGMFCERMKARNGSRALGLVQF